MTNLDAFLTFDISLNNFQGDASDRGNKLASSPETGKTAFKGRELLRQRVSGVTLN
jgi:hypothetical protein